MNLGLSNMKDITTGAVRIENSAKGISFYRFTEQQQEAYKNRSDDFYMKSFSASGVKMRFRTNSETLYLKVDVEKGSSRSYFSFDVYVNGEKIDVLKNFSDKKLPLDYTKIDLPLGEYSKNFNLGAGEKDVCIYFPWSVKVTLKELAIDDNSFVTPLNSNKKLLCFGDSITQGYDALYPSNKYTTQLANMLEADEYNKAIGGEIFFPKLPTMMESFEPDYITVAYGTNDWNVCKKEHFCNHCREFFDNLTSNYQHAKIIAITPIWRKDCTEQRDFESFESIEKNIKSIAQDYENVVVITGFDFVNHDENFFADLRLHPNDEGLKQYFKNLAKQITTN